ncbi:MAG: hypothetical protein H7641_12475 [Candidatus Heimdallarchaeota archaeon]|nr:hypothetical protein [Candidatus Heimdallarchaeota archaeon]MCK4878374.1 hypothetical protein [Candidatus Heimdallarchaeota archaeon]
MPEKLSKEDFKFFLLNSKKEISYIFDILDDKEALDIISFLFYEPSNFKTLKVEFGHIDKNKLSSYITNFWDFGIIEVNRHNKYQITKTGKEFFQLTIQLVVEALMSQEVTDEKMRKILVQKVGEKELKQFKKERQENKAKGMQLSQMRY